MTTIKMINPKEYCREYKDSGNAMKLMQVLWDIKAQQAEGDKECCLQVNLDGRPLDNYENLDKFIKHTQKATYAYFIVKEMLYKAGVVIIKI